MDKRTKRQDLSSEDLNISIKTLKDYKVVISNPLAKRSGKSNSEKPIDKRLGDPVTLKLHFAGEEHYPIFARKDITVNMKFDDKQNSPEMSSQANSRESSPVKSEKKDTLGRKSQSPHMNHISSPCYREQSHSPSNRRTSSKEELYLNRSSTVKETNSRSKSPRSQSPHFKNHTLSLCYRGQSRSPSKKRTLSKEESPHLNSRTPSPYYSEHSRSPSKEKLHFNKFSSTKTTSRRSKSPYKDSRTRRSRSLNFKSRTPSPCYSRRSYSSSKRRSPSKSELRSNRRSKSPYKDSRTRRSRSLHFKSRTPSPYYRRSHLSSKRKPSSKAELHQRKSPYRYSRIRRSRSPHFRNKTPSPCSSKHNCSSYETTSSRKKRHYSRFSPVRNTSRRSKSPYEDSRTRRSQSSHFKSRTPSRCCSRQRRLSPKRRTPSKAELHYNTNKRRISPYKCSRTRRSQSPHFKNRTPSPCSSRHSCLSYERKTSLKEKWRLNNSSSARNARRRSKSPYKDSSQYSKQRKYTSYTRSHSRSQYSDESFHKYDKHASDSTERIPGNSSQVRINQRCNTSNKNNILCNTLNLWIPAAVVPPSPFAPRGFITPQLTTPPNIRLPHPPYGVPYIFPQSAYQLRPGFMHNTYNASTQNYRHRQEIRDKENKNS